MLLLDTQIDYTKTNIYCEDKIVLESKVIKERNVSFRDNFIFSHFNIDNYISYTRVISKRRKPSPFGLKKIISKRSAIVIAKSLNKSK